jgi:hypothetical protein
MKMTLPQEIVLDLEQLGVDIAPYEQLANMKGVDVVRRIVQMEVEEVTVFREWYPRLAAFAVAKRQSTPLPLPSELTEEDHAFRRILEPKIRDAERVPVRGRATAVVFTAPLCTLSIVKSQWPGSVDNAVFLTREELREWNDNHDYSASEFWWCVRQWWDVSDHDKEGSTMPALAPDEVPWFVSSGLCWGGLAGGEDTELWAWNGRKERFVQELSVSQF